MMAKYLMPVNQSQMLFTTVNSQVNAFSRRLVSKSMVTPLMNTTLSHMSSQDNLNLRPIRKLVITETLDKNSQSKPNQSM